MSNFFVGLEKDKMYGAYDEGYQVFLKNWLTNRQVAIDLMQENLKPYPPQVTILSVGPGPGDFDVQVIDSLQKHLPKELKLRYVTVEPNYMHRQRFGEEVRMAGLSNIDLQMHPVEIEDFETDEKFDIIHYTHCLYHMPGHEKQIVQNAMAMLKDNGFIIITLCTADSVMLSTIYKYTALTGEGSTDLLEIEKMQKIVDELGFSYNVVDYPEFIDCQLCFEQDSSEGKALMDFLCYGNTSILSDKQRKEILDIVVANIKEQDGRKLISSNGATMIIPKQIFN